MSGLTVVPYAGGKEEADRWDNFVEGCPNATFLHTRRFLSHGKADTHARDCSALVLDQRHRIVGAFPAAVLPEDGVVCSHSRATYGGLVHQGYLGGENSYEALQALALHYRAAGFKRLLYRAVPHIFHAVPSQDDLSALYRMGARAVARELSVAVSPMQPRKANQKRLWGSRKALRAGVSVSSGTAESQQARELWDIITKNITERHQANPTHVWSEIEDLTHRFAEKIDFAWAAADGETLGGVIVWRMPTAHHAQYTGASNRGRKLRVLDAVFEHLIEDAHASGRWFSFGISTLERGMKLNADLHQFKSEFGGGGIIHETLELALA